MDREISPPEPALTHRISQLAFEYWVSRGRPFGSAEEDWYRAEAEILEQTDLYTLHETWEKSK
jgi:hypothetical protein